MKCICHCFYIYALFLPHAVFISHCVLKPVFGSLVLLQCSASSLQLMCCEINRHIDCDNEENFTVFDKCQCQYLI